MSIVATEDAAKCLEQLVDKSQLGEDVVLTRSNQPVAKIVGLSVDRPQPCKGSGKDLIAYIAPDFDDTPDGFEEYMPRGCA